MSAPQIPDDLLQAQRAFEDADRKVHAHVEATTAEHGKAWPEAEEKRLEELRGERMVALKALTGHPAIVAAGASRAQPALMGYLRVRRGGDNAGAVRRR